MTDRPCNLPFERIPVCACDPGAGKPPTRQQMMECKLRGGPCRESNEPQEPTHHDRPRHAARPARTRRTEGTGRMSLNPDQRLYVADMAKLPQHRKCMCGWYEREECESWMRPFCDQKEMVDRRNGWERHPADDLQ